MDSNGQKCELTVETGTKTPKTTAVKGLGWWFKVFWDCLLFPHSLLACLFSHSELGNGCFSIALRTLTFGMWRLELGMVCLSIEGSSDFTIWCLLKLPIGPITSQQLWYWTGTSVVFLRDVDDATGKKQKGDEEEGSLTSRCQRWQHSWAF